MRETLFLFCLVTIFGFPIGSIANQEATKIDQKTEELKAHLEQERLQEMEEEVRGQKYMIGDWGAYGKELEKASKQQKEEQKTQNEIEQLEQQKADMNNKSK